MRMIRNPTSTAGVVGQPRPVAEPIVPHQPSTTLRNWVHSWKPDYLRENGEAPCEPIIHHSVIAMVRESLEER